MSGSFFAVVLSPKSCDIKKKNLLIGKNLFAERPVK